MWILYSVKDSNNINIWLTLTSDWEYYYSIFGHGHHQTSSEHHRFGMRQHKWISDQLELEHDQRMLSSPFHLSPCFDNYQLPSKYELIHIKYIKLSLGTKLG